MKPRLVVVSGKRKGTVAQLNNEEMTIGRDAANGLCLSEDEVSRRHCAIKSDGDIYRIVDFTSRNGTFVNGIPVREKVLQHGNTIRLGYTVLVFLTEEDEAETCANALEPSKDEPLSPSAGRTLIMSPADRRLVLGSELPDLGNMVRDLNAFLKISSRINTVYKTDLQQREFLELMFEVTPAERGSIVLSSGVDDGETATSLRRWW
jgi:pSer/pThr/pTyr-binding forkhead associated (FHA) protein